MKYLIVKMTPELYASVEFSNKINTRVMASTYAISKQAGYWKLRENTDFLWTGFVTDFENTFISPGRSEMPLLKITFTCVWSSLPLALPSHPGISQISQISEANFDSTEVSEKLI